MSCIDTKNFKKSEFTCKCGCGLNNVSPELLEMLQHARDDANDIRHTPLEISFPITSGCRCYEHNVAVEGSMNSTHMEGFAADIKVRSRDRYAVLAGLFRAGFERIGIASSFIHVDIAEDRMPAVWLYK